MLTTKDIQRQEAVFVVKAIEVTPFLLAVDDIVSGIKTQNQLAGRLGKTGNELLQQHLMQADRRLLVVTLFQTMQGGRASQRFENAHCRLDCAVVAQDLVIIEIFIAQGQAENTLLQQFDL